MASQQPTLAPESLHSAQVVGNAFVNQYYLVLHQSPELVYRFYQENSKLGRPDPKGDMNSVTTIQAINEKIMSMEFKDRKEIKTVDAQESLNGGVIVLVTGYITGEDNVRRDFAQSFFLASQDPGYFVLNDVFRYTDEAAHQQENQVLDEGAPVTPSPDQDTPPLDPELPESPVLPPEASEEEEKVNEESVYNPSDNEVASVAKVEEPLENEAASVVKVEAPIEEVIDEVSNSSPSEVVDSITPVTQEEAPKKTYASIVKVMKENPAPLSAPRPLPSRPAHVKLERQAAPAPTPAPPAAEIPGVASNNSETSSIQEADDGHSVYIKSLPLNATPAQLEEEFKRFGPIKPGGIQVRSHKQQGFCFGFVEFEVASAVQTAIEASPVTIGGRQVFVEEKRPPGSRFNMRGRYLPGRGGGFRSDGMRGGRGSYGGGRGYSYGRGEFGNRAELGSRGGGRVGNSSNQGDDGDQVGPAASGRGNRGSTAGNPPPKDAAPSVSAPA